MNQKETYQTPKVDIWRVCLEGNLLQTSTKGYKNDEDFDPRFFGLE